MKFENNILNKPFTNKEYADFASFCNKNNLIIEDKVKFFEGVKPKISLENLKNDKFDLLKNNVENYFYKNYPLYKQNNIAIFGSNEEKQNFKNFYDLVVNKYNEIICNIKNCQNNEELENINLNFEV